MNPQGHPGFYKIAKLGFRLVRRPLLFAKKYYDAYRALVPANAYNAWAQREQNYCYVKQDINYRPLISIVVPVFNTPERYLMELVYSVINQHYDNFELILVNASNNPKSIAQVNSCLEIDDRIRVVEAKENKGISANTNLGINEAAGEYIAFADHDDLLHPCALHSVTESLQAKDRPDLIYTDEDKISADSNRFFGPHCKPDWSVDLLRNVNYITHLTVVRRQVAMDLNGLRPKTDGAQDYDLLLRAVDEHQPKITHIARILYHWRAAEVSTASSIENKQYVLNAGAKALNEHLARNHIKAKGSAIAGKPGFYKVTYQPIEFAVVIGPVAKNRQAACAIWLNHLFEDYQGDPSIQLVIGEWYQKFKNDSLGLDIEYVQENDDYWEQALKSVEKEAAICFKVMAVPAKITDLAQLAAAATDTGHSFIAPVITNENQIIISSGLVHSQGLPRKLFEGYKFGVYTWFGNTDWVRNVDDLTCEIVAVGRQNFKKLYESYDKVFTLRSLKSIGQSDNYNFVIWAYTPFEQIGVLDPSDEISYHSIKSFRFMPTTFIHIDEWKMEYDRDEK